MTNARSDMDKDTQNTWNKEASNERLKRLAMAVLAADRGHLEQHRLLTQLIPILEEKEPLLAIGIGVLAASMSKRCQDLLAVVTETLEEAAADQ